VVKFGSGVVLRELVTRDERVNYVAFCLALGNATIAH
jgi:hypothetical protein